MDESDAPIGEDTVLAPQETNPQSGPFDFLRGMPETDIDKLLASGQISDDTAATLNAANQVDPDTARKRELYNQLILGAPSAYAQAKGAPPVENDQVFGPQGQEPANLNATVAQQAVDALAAEKAAALQAQAQKQQQQEQSNAARAAMGLAPLPTTTDQVAETAKQEAANQLAVEVGAQQAQEEVAKKEVSRGLAEEDRAEARVRDTEQKVAEDQVKNKDSWGKAIAQAIAIMAGAIGQGMTGAKSNPALDVLDKMAEQEAQEKKYNEEQKMALRKQLLEEAMMQLRLRSEATESAFKRAQLAGLHLKFQKDMGDMVQAQQMQAKIQGGGGFTPSELTTMDPEFKQTMIQVRPGIFKPTIHKDTRELQKTLNDYEGGLYEAKKLRQYGKEFGNNIFQKLVDREGVGAAETSVRGLIGGLRLAYFGPGVLTNTEQALAEQMIGNPTAAFSLASANAAKINSIINKLNFMKKTALRNAGVDIPLGQNEKWLAAYKRKGLKDKNGRLFEDSEIINKLVEENKWNSSEE